MQINRGTAVEHLFSYEALERGYLIATPLSVEPFDIILVHERKPFKVQIKHTNCNLGGDRYKLNATKGNNKLYPTEAYDILAVYIFATKMWYLFPFAEIQSKKSIYIIDRADHWTFKYQENWAIFDNSEYTSSKFSG